MDTYTSLCIIKSAQQSPYLQLCTTRCAYVIISNVHSERCRNDHKKVQGRESEPVFRFRSHKWISSEERQKNAHLTNQPFGSNWQCPTLVTRGLYVELEGVFIFWLLQSTKYVFLKVAITRQNLFLTLRHCDQHSTIRD